MNPFPRRLRGVSACAGLLLLAGCLPRVEDVIADKHSYLDNHFTSDSLQPDVLTAISGMDTRPVGFQQIKFRVLFRRLDNNAISPLTARETLLNSGPGLVRSLAEDYINDIPITQYYELSYRGLVKLRTEEVKLTERLAPRPTEITSIQHFEALPPAAGSKELAYDYMADPFGVHIRCTVGATQPASALNAAFSGDAINLACEQHNQQGTLISKYLADYLVDYGTTLITQTLSIASTGTAILWQYQDVQIE